MRALFPIDGTEAGYGALEQGLALLRAAARLEVTLLTVMQEGFEDAADPAYVQETFEADEEDEVFPTEASSQRALARGLDVAKRHGIAAKAKAESGRPREEILKEAAHHDLLVLRAPEAGLHLRSRGVERLARAAPCAVLYVRPTGPGGAKP